MIFSPPCSRDYFPTSLLAMGMIKLSSPHIFYCEKLQTSSVLVSQDCYRRLPKTKNKKKREKEITTKGEGFNQQKFILSQFWRLEVQSQGVNRAVFPLKALGKNLSLFLSVSGGSRSSSVCGCKICLYHRLAFPVCLCLNFSLLRRILVIGFRARPTPAWPYLDHICKDLISKWSDIYKLWIDMNFRGILFNPVHVSTLKKQTNSTHLLTHLIPMVVNMRNEKRHRQGLPQWSSS